MGDTDMSVGEGYTTEEELNALFEQISIIYLDMPFHSEMETTCFRFMKAIEDARDAISGDDN
jgi:hypothetical protein